MWSFGVFTDGKNNIGFHDIVVKSIHDCGVPEYEILFVTENTHFKRPEPVLYVDLPLCNHLGQVHCVKKNSFAKIAKYSKLCIIHDYITLDSNFYKAFEKFGDDWDVCSIPFRSNDGTRWWDWRVEGHPVHGHSLTSYDCPATQWHFVTGNLFMVKKDFIIRNPMSTIGESEDWEWSNSVKSFWKYKLNKFTGAASLKPKYISPEHLKNANLML